MPFLPDSPNYKPTSNKSGFIPDSQRAQGGFPTEEPPEIKRSFMQRLAEVGKGAIKGAQSTVSNLGTLGQKGLEGITGRKLGIPTLNETLGDRLKPTNTEQKIGFGAEQVGEFLVPGLGGAKVAKTAGLATKIGLGAVESGLVTTAQGGNKKEILTSSLLGGAGTIAVRGVEKALTKIPKTAWSTILKRTPTEIAKNPNLASQAADTGLSGLSRSSILSKAQNNIQLVETALDDLLSKTNKVVDGQKVAGYLNSLKKSYGNIPGESSAVSIIDNIQAELASKGKITAVEANKLKRDIYELVNKSYGKGMLEVPAKTEAQKIAASGLKQEIEKIIPEAKSLNEKQAVYIQMRKALDKALTRTEGKGIAGTGVGMYDLLVGGLGTGVGVATGNPFAGLLLVGGKKTLESTAVMSGVTKMAKYYDKLSPTKKLLFYRALQGMTIKGVNAIQKPTSEK